MRKGLQFFVSILLARLLMPEDFGVIAMLYVFISLAGVFIDSGFSSALIQRQGITHTDESTVFFFNLCMAAFASFTLCLFAPWIAGFFGLPVLQSLTYVMALNLLIGAFGSIHNTLLNKALDFKTIAKVGVVASSVSGLFAIAMAWWGFGVWSLALQTLLSSLISVAFLWRWHQWRPRWEFSLVSLRSLFRFGGYMMLSGVLDTLYTQLYAVLIGKLFSARELGYYARADSTQQLPVAVLTSVLNRVAFPIFSEAAVDPARLKMGVRKILVTIMLLNIPVMLGLAVLAEQLIVTLFGVKWLPSVPFLQVLCLGGVIWPLHVINLNALMAQGRSDLFFRIEMIKKAVGLPLIVLASWHSVLAIAWIVVLQGVFAFFINAHYSRVLLGYGAWQQLRDTLPYFGVGLTMALSIWWGSQVMDLSPVVELAVLSVAGAVLYFVSCHFLRLAAFKEIVEIAKRGRRQ
jgi:teichuronic acid exporter